MKNYLRLLLAGLFVFACAFGCKKDSEEKAGTQEFAPKKGGERGTSCVAKNDCEDDLSCILGICQVADFGVEATMKECYQIDCETTQDCCGERKTEAPAKCRDREVYCNPNITGCETVGTSCYGPSDCAGNAICAGTRLCNFRGTVCSADTDCAETCEFPAGMGGAGTLGTCSIFGTACLSDTDCNYAGDTCGAGYCSCDNPNYNPSNPICTDTDCDDVCTLVCENSQCVEDTSCESNADCVAGFRNICSDVSGDCVECETNSDCDDPDDALDDDDECNEMGSCFRPCRGDAECPMLHACQEGDCNYVGCRTTPECILLGINAGLEDNRLLTCEKDENGIGTCTVQCEIDAHCPESQVCEGGACKYIGCLEDSDCYGLLGLNGWVRDEFTPWVPTAVCQLPPSLDAE